MHKILSKIIFLWINPKHRLYFLTAVFSLFAAGFLYFSGLPFQSSEPKENLEELFFSKEPGSFEKWCAEIKKDPLKMQIFGGLAFQRFIELGKEKEALGFLEKAQKQLEGDYLDFVKISGKITEKKLKEALVDGYRLKTRLKEFKKQDTLLYSLNLLRIALLESRLEQDDKALQAFGELENYLKQKSHKSMASMALSSAKEPTFLDFVLFCKAKLKQKA
ncbi:MAG: hypothetical protein WC371_05645 [Parachlamydiales bacterium]|jgi:hypothetical protein